MLWKYRLVIKKILVHTQQQNKIFNNYEEDSPNKFNLWEFIRNNFTVIISIIAIILLIIVIILLIAVVNKKKEPQRPEEQNGEAEMINQKGQKQMSDEDKIIRILVPSKDFDGTYAAKRLAVPIQDYYRVLLNKIYDTQIHDHDDVSINDKPLFNVDYDCFVRIPFNERYVFFNNETDPEEKVNHDDIPPLSNTMVNKDGILEKL